MLQCHQKALVYADKIIQVFDIIFKKWKGREERIPINRSAK